MAEDNVASLSTEVSESEKKLAEKMQELNRKLIVDEIFVRIPRSPSNYILGPCFKNVFAPELSPRYPLAEGEKLLLHSAEPDCFKGKTLRSWPNVSRTWIDWVDRVEKAKWEVWKSADIYDAIQLSKHDIPMDKNLLCAALCYWSISTNSFHFRFGMMGPTVLDIVALIGLRPHGEDVTVPLWMAESACDFPKYGKIKECLTYCKFLDVSMGAMAVTEEEHISLQYPSRDLPYSILLEECLKCKCGVEHYSPNQFARQFGMTQAIPFHQSANDLSVRRENFESADNIKETKSRFYQLKRKFSFVPFNINPSSTEFFDSWWSTYIKNRDKTNNYCY